MTEIVQQPNHPDLSPNGGEKLDGRSIEFIMEEIRQVYLADANPWVIGYSGGKDSTVALQLTWNALAKLPPEERTKPVYVIASDTLVETPVIVDYITQTLERINIVAKNKGMPFKAHKVLPQLKDTFWVNMIGKGYPAPYRRFRWCTDRLKIAPANRFVEEKVDRFGEVVLVLGVRRAESATRAQVISLHRKRGERLSRHTTLKGALVYTPIEWLTIDDVWTYLLAVPSPWGNNNRDLVTMYRNAQAGECPLVVDKTTPSCGNSRFGCWTCTVVEQDRSMQAMIENGEEWMEPLLELRDWLATTRDPKKKRQYREVRRRDGTIRTWGEKNDKLVWGPYKFEIRKQILRMLLQAQQEVRRSGPDDKINLVSEAELHEIRRIWRTEGDWTDSLPTLYREVTGEDLDWLDEDVATGNALDNEILDDVCTEAELPSGLIRELVDLERELQGLGRRKNVFDRIDRILKKDWRDEARVLEEINWTESEQAEGVEEGEDDAA